VPSKLDTKHKEYPMSEDTMCITKRMHLVSMHAHAHEHTHI